jgi:Beta-propeller repeat
LSKPATPKRIFTAVCIVAVTVVAAVAFIAVASVKSSGRLSSAVDSAVASKSPAVTPAEHARINAAYAALPLAFEANQGQVDPQVKYMARGNGYKLYLASSEVVFTLHKRGEDSEVRQMMMNRRIGLSKIKSMFRHRQQTLQAAAVHMYMLGANPDAQVAAQEPQEGKVNYFIGKDPSQWHSGIPLFGQVSYRRLYPGVDLAFHGSGKQLEFDYLVSPGANTKAIALGFRGADRVTTNAAGNLVLTTAAGAMELNRPIAYQEQNGKREIVDARYVVHAGEVKFALGPYDHSRQLVIDPTVTYSTYFGGDFADYGLAIAVDASGNEYVAGATDSDSIPDWNSATNSSSFDVFVTEISSAGVLQFTTEFGGSSDDFPGGIAVDTAGIYISGTTDSSDFPVTAGAAQTLFLGGVADGNNDAFAVKLGLTGSLTWGTYIAGSDSDSGLGVAVDSSHNVYVVGETFSTNLGGAVGGVNPLPSGGQLNLGLGTGDDDGYIVKLNSTGTAYALVSYLGGSNGDLATGVALDPLGNIYVSGETVSVDLPVTPGVVQGECGTDGKCNGSASSAFDDAYIFAIDANLAAYKYVTYYGGSNADDAFGIAADSSGDAFITGDTLSTDFKTAGTPFQSSLAGTQNAFVVELNPTGTAALYGTYLGGNGTDFGLGIAVDSSGNAYVTGQTSSTQTSPGAFPLVNPNQPAFGGSTDAFVTVLSTNQNLALFSTYLGGGGDEDQLGGAVALDSSHNIYVTGDTDSGNGSTAVFPTKSALDGTFGGGTCTINNGTVPCPDAFIAAYSPATVADFAIAATAPTAVSPGSSGTSTVTLTSLNGYNSSVSLNCSVSGTGSPAPACSASSFNPGSVTPANPAASSTLTITTTGSSAAMFRPSKFLYAMWLPIAGFSLMGMGFSSARSRRKKLLGFLMIGMVMTALFLMPACGGSSSNTGGGGGGGGCSGCTPAGTYTVTITGTGTDANTTTHSTTVMLTVN